MTRHLTGMRTACGVRLSQDRLGASNKPVLIVPGMYFGTEAPKESEDNAEGLQSKLLLMEKPKSHIYAEPLDVTGAHKWHNVCDSYQLFSFILIEDLPDGRLMMGCRPFLLFPQPHVGKRMANLAFENNILCD